MMIDIMSGRTNPVPPDEMGRTNPSYPGLDQPVLPDITSNLGRTNDVLPDITPRARIYESNESIITNNSSSSTTSNNQKTTTTKNRVREVSREIASIVPDKNGTSMVSLGKSTMEQYLSDDEIREMGDKLGRIDNSLAGSGWTRKLIRHAEQQVGVVDEKIFRESIVKLFAGLEAKKGKINSPSGWARVTFVNILQESIVE